MLNSLIDIDKWLLLFFNGMHNPTLDFLMYWISTKILWIPLYALLLFFIVKNYKWHSITILIFIVVLIVVTDQVSNIFKYSVMRLRPCHNADIGSMVHLVKNHCGGDYGFISAHAANSFALATFTAYLFNKNIFTFFIFGWATLVAFSRIYLGVHFPGDILAGALVGIIVALVIIYALKLLPEKYFSHKDDLNSIS